MLDYLAEKCRAGKQAEDKPRRFDCAQGSLLSSKGKSGQDIADEVDEPVADHVGHEVAAPNEKERAGRWRKSVARTYRSTLGCAPIDGLNLSAARSPMVSSFAALCARPDRRGALPAVRTHLCSVRT